MKNNILLAMLSQVKLKHVSYDTREEENIEVFLNCMGRLHCNHLKHDIDQFVKNVTSEMVDKHDYEKELVDKWSIKPNLADKLSDILLFMVDKEEIPLRRD